MEGIYAVAQCLLYIVFIRKGLLKLLTHLIILEKHKKQQKTRICYCIESWVWDSSP